MTLLGRPDQADSDAEILIFLEIPFSRTLIGLQSNLILKSSVNLTG